MKLVAKYERRDVFGNRIYTTDHTECGTIDDVRMLFRKFKKDRAFAFEVNYIVVVWDTFSDFDEDIVTVRTYDKWNSYSDKRMTFAEMKKYVLGKVM